jgi:hypothetical protein
MKPAFLLVALVLLIAMVAIQLGGSDETPAARVIPDDPTPAQR